jgi:DNA-binding NarL/FixJ family response regulator
MLPSLPGRASGGREAVIGDVIKVLLADDHPATRAGVRHVLEGHGFSVCAEVADADAAIEAARRERPDLCLLDVNMPGGGIKAAREIASALPEAHVVMLTVSYDDADLFDSIKAGASGYLLKDMDPGRLPYALHGVLSGEAAVPRPLVARLMEEFRAREGRRRLPALKERGASLTTREWQILELLREGLTTSKIADRLYVSPVTVRSHVRAILKKLDVPDRESAISLFDPS